LDLKVLRMIEQSGGRFYSSVGDIQPDPAQLRRDDT